jgi:1,2-phenylacetyl-CoA epoxidase catalytic subunit
MLKKTIKYTDYNGKEREEDFFFHFNKAELAEMEMSTTGGLTEMLKKIVKEEDSKAIIQQFKELILKSYGEKTPDGKHFIKSEALSTAFSQTEAYSILFMELASDAEAAARFVNGIVPNDPDKTDK